jgi:pilus biogenesis lipoprotein CpaD
MYQSIPSFAATRLKLTLLAAAVLLAGCTTDGASFDDQYVPTAHYERYPIKVAKAPMRLEVQQRSGGLQPAQINAISNFSRSAGQASASLVAINRPSGGGNHTADQIYQLMISQGVPAGQISRTTYRGSRKSPVVVSFTRTVAVTKECGDWSSDLNHSPGNLPYENFGCAIQHNTAQMVSNPSDFEIPEATTPATSSARAWGYNIYSPSLYLPPTPPAQ